MKVLVACHHPITDGAVTKSSLGDQPIEYDYVDNFMDHDEKTLQTKGWVVKDEYDNIYNYYYNQAKESEYETDDDDYEYTDSSEEDAKELTEIVTEKIKELRKGTYPSALETLRKIPGHSNTTIYSKSDWSDVPDNTYDYVYSNHCPIYEDFSKNGNFSIKKSEVIFPINALLRQSLRVLKPGGSLIFMQNEDYDPRKDPLLKIPGFKLESRTQKKGSYNHRFPEFWVSYDQKVMGYVMVDDKLEQREIAINTANADYTDNRKLVKLTKQSSTQDDLEAETLTAMRTGGRKTYRMPRKYSKKYCQRTTCKKMGFTQRSSCRPYKNCFRSGRGGGSETVSK